MKIGCTIDFFFILKVTVKKCMVNGANFHIVFNVYTKNEAAPKNNKFKFEFTVKLSNPLVGKGF